MKVCSVKNHNISFCRALSSKEAIEARALQKEALNFLGCKDIITIIPDASFPTKRENFIGQGHINSPEISDFLDFWKTYTASNNIKILPNGEIYKGGEKGFHCAYRTSTLTLGINTINLNDLSTSEYGNILPHSVIEKVKAKAIYDNMYDIANFENVCGNKSMQNMALFEAYKNFNKFRNKEILNLKKEFLAFKEEYAPFIKRRALYETLCDIHQTQNIDEWGILDKNLYNSSITDEVARKIRICELEKKYPEKIDFVYFKQFIAEKSLAKARALLHKKGFKLTGDCPIGYSPDERWGYQDAFSGAKVGWGMPGIDYKQLYDGNSEASRLFNLKIKACAKRYDNLRVDCGWMYVQPKLITSDCDVIKRLKNKGYIYQRTEFGNQVFRLEKSDYILNIIEKIFKEVKGNKYSQKDLMYEIEAAGADFAPWTSSGVIDALKNRRVVVSTMYMDKDYANLNFFKSKHLPKSDLVLMSGNHDNLALHAFANRMDTNGMLSSNGKKIQEMLVKQYDVLAPALGIQRHSLENPKEFVKAKFAYNFLTENIKMFFMDVFGRFEQFDLQNGNGAINYRYMISSDYERAFHLALQNGRGLNIFDALAKAMKARGGDNLKPKVYQKLLYFANILYEKGSLTLKDADRKVMPKKNNFGVVFWGCALAAGVGAILLNKRYTATKKDSQKRL